MHSHASIDLSPELFDLPGDMRPRRIFRASGCRPDPKSKATGKRKKLIWHECYINSPTPIIANRVALREMRIYRCKLHSMIELTWREYGEILSRSGFTVIFPPAKS